MLIILTPQDMTDPTKTAEELVRTARNLDKPLLASWMGGNGVSEGERVLNRANIPAFPYPDTAARMFDYMANYAAILGRLYETPMLAIDDENPPDSQGATEIIRAVRDSDRTVLTEYESKKLLAAYGIPTVETRIAENEDQAVQIANEIGYPVVVKLHSETITHKTDVGGVKLNLSGPDEVRNAFQEIEKAVKNRVWQSDTKTQGDFLGVTVQPMASMEGYELILGSSIDPQFGPVILFGMGGTLVEVFKDSALGLPPLNTTLARQMMERTKIYTALKGVRGVESVNMDELEQLLVRFSTLISEQRCIKELDINPLLVSPQRLLALDARVLVYGPEVLESAPPQLAIRPYPTQYVSHWTAKDGTPITIRPIRAEDEPLIVKFHETLSDRSVYLRYLHPMLLSDRAAHERLSRICHCDYEREITLIADHADAEEGQLRILGAARMTKLHGTNAARFSVLISDLCQGMGVGSILLQRLIDVARGEKLSRLEAIMTQDNQAMRNLCEQQGFHLTKQEDGMLRAELEL